MKKRIRVAGLVEMNDGIALMHRKNVKPTPNTDKPYGEYYVFPGGGLEESDLSLEDGVKREILEEFGIEVDVGNKMGQIKINETNDEYLFYCKYKSGKLGTGTGPEFSGDPKYINRGNYIPEIVKFKNIKNIRIIPEEFKLKVIEMYEL